MEQGSGNRAGEQGKRETEGASRFPFPFTLFLYSPLPSSLFSCSPFNAAFLRRIDLGLFCHRQSFGKQVTLEVVEEKVLRVGTGEVEAVVIDDLRLLLQPAGPARLTNLSRDSLPEFVGKKARIRSPVASRHSVYI